MPQLRLLRGCAVALVVGLFARPAGTCHAGQHCPLIRACSLFGCVDCDAGQFSAGDPRNGSRPMSCTKCEQGQYAPSKGAGSCRACAPGQYYGGTGASSCRVCPSGQYSSSSGASRCQECDAGQSPNVQHNRCEACAGGKYSKQGQDSCTSCRAGQHSSSGAGSCTDCHVGQYSREGKASCTDCPEGQYADSAGKGACTDCPEGQYADSAGQSVCKACPPHSTSATGSTQISACRCNAGYTGTITTEPDSSCTPCNAGKSKSELGPALCQDCHPGQYQDEGAQPSCKSCEQGKDACSCRGERNNWPRGPGGLCTQSTACQDLEKCREHATCTPTARNDTEPTWEYSCNCNEQFLFGLKCERECLNGPTHSDQPYCDNVGSFCVYDPSRGDGYKCNCATGWSGEHCEKMNPCTVLAPCRNGQGDNCTTSSTVSSGYTCDCETNRTGFSGPNCTVLKAAWNTHESQLHLVIIGALLLTCYIGAYGYILRAFETETLRKGVSIVALSTVVVCVVLAIKASMINPECEPVSGNIPRSSDTSCTTESLGSRAFVLYSTTVATCVLQSAIAVGLYIWNLRRFPNFAHEGASRLLRGAGYPLLAVVLASLGIFIGVRMNPDRLTPRRIDSVADAFVIYGWGVATFGVLLPLLPLAVVVSRMYLQEQQLRRGYLSENKQDDLDPELSTVVTRRSLRGGEKAARSLARTGQDYSTFLYDCGVPNPILFLRAEFSFAALSGLLFPFFWNAHLVNEQQELLTFANSHKSTVPEIRYTRQVADKTEFASVDGVRALSPVVCCLNFIASGWIFYMIFAFPAPLTWTASMYFGVSWCAAAAILLLYLNFMLIRSLSESRYAASKREIEIIWGWGTHGHVRSSSPKPSCCDLCKEVVSCLKTYATSWSGQTAISGVNHLFAIAFFSYGLHAFGPGGFDVLSPELKKFLWSGIGLTVLGVVTSSTSYLQRRWPQLKYFPTDDSFRVACVLKALLVMNKALIVYELSKIDLKQTPGLESWTIWVTAVCVLSVFILGLLTYAFDACRVYRNPSLVEDVGVADGKKFVRMYSLSFFCCKIATVFFVLLGHIPNISGCDKTPVSFEGSKDLDEIINCTLCFPPRPNATDTTLDERCEIYKETNYVVHACTTDCATLFFSGTGTPDDPTPILLDVFVLVPMLWLPFAVYSNNEVARMIDGIWQRKKERERTRSGSGLVAGIGVRGSDRLLGISTGSNIHSAAKVGLSMTAHGYNAVVNLAHAIFLLCFVAMLWFLYISKGGYHVHAPEGLDEGEFQKSLDKAGTVVTMSVVSMNSLMMCRLLYESILYESMKTLCKLVCNVFQRTPNSGSDISQPVLNEDTSRLPLPQQPEPEQEPEPDPQLEPEPGKQQFVSRPASPQGAE